MVTVTRTNTNKKWVFRLNRNIQEAIKATTITYCSNRLKIAILYNLK